MNNGQLHGELNYPAAGSHGAVVTLVEILIDQETRAKCTQTPSDSNQVNTFNLIFQSSSIGRAYVVSGGIGERRS